jgi:hypothetical protein
MDLLFLAAIGLLLAAAEGAIRFLDRLARRGTA